MNRDNYIRLRNKYHPNILNLIFLLESPPVSGKYFYDESGKTSEPLFNALMKLLDNKPADKNYGLDYLYQYLYRIVTI